jgi:hypothetical protein
MTRLVRTICPAHKCMENLKARQVLCDSCWARVPGELRDRIADAWIPDAPSPIFKRALEDAVQALLQKSLTRID